MYGAVGFWGWPADGSVEAFEADYTANYLPIVRTIPGITRVDAFLADESGRESDVYRVGGVFFQDKAGYDAATLSPEWAAMFAYADHLIGTYGIGMRFALVSD